MLTKFNFSNDMNTVASDMINAYISNGYKIDARESVITSDDKDCTFKAVLKKNIDGAECKTIITLTDNGDDTNKHCTYRKVDLVGDTKWSEETRTFSSGNSVNTSCSNSLTDSLTDDEWIKRHRDRMKRISDRYNLGWDWFGEDPITTHFNRLADIINTDSKQTEKTKSDVDHIKVNANDTEQDLYNKIVNKREEHKKVNKTNDENKMSDAVDKTKHSTTNKKTNDLPKQDPEDEIEDSLIKLVRYIFCK